MKATIGSNDLLSQTGGALSATLQGDGDTVDATNVGLPGGANGTKVNANGNNETLDWTNSGGDLQKPQPLVDERRLDLQRRISSTTTREMCRSRT